MSPGKVTQLSGKTLALLFVGYLGQMALFLTPWVPTSIVAVRRVAGENVCEGPGTVLLSLSLSTTAAFFDVRLQSNQ